MTLHADQGEARTTAGHIPSRYAVNSVLRDINDSWDIDSEGHWTRMLFRMVRDRSISAEGVRTAMTEGQQAPSLVNYSSTQTRRVGKTTVRHDVMRMCADRLVEDGAYDDHRVVIVRREQAITSQHEVEIRSAPAGIGFDQHVIARLYEREGLSYGDAIGRLRSDLANLEKTVAFAHAAGLFKIRGSARRAPGQRDTTYSPGSASMVPFGDGLMIVKSRDVRTSGPGCVRSRLFKSGQLTMAGTTHPEKTRHEKIDGRSFTRHHVTMGVTYVSYDYLRPEQRDYLALFEDEMAKADLAAISADVGRVWFPHEKPDPLPTAVVPPRLHDLLRGNVTRGRIPAPFTAIGWDPQKDDEIRARGLESARMRAGPAHQHLNPHRRYA